jgi:hypothetical protein
VHKIETLTEQTGSPGRRVWKLAALVSCAVLLSLTACEHRHARFDPALANAFFPLVPSTVWTYRVNSKSQRESYVVTDKVVGVKYVPALNVTGQVVEEYYNLDRGGSRPIVYVTRNGYLTRLSGLEYSKAEIAAPAWGRSEEGDFMPARVTPEISWTSTIFPFGHMADAFDIKQSHRIFLEDSDVVVPAGHFAGCIRIDTVATYEGGSFSKNKEKNSILLYRDWYGPNVGLVKTEVLEGGPNGPRMELVELLKFVNPAQTIASAAHADN